MLKDGRIKNVTNVISLDAHFTFFKKWNAYFQTATIF